MESVEVDELNALNACTDSPAFDWQRFDATELQSWTGAVVQRFGDATKLEIAELFRKCYIEEPYEGFLTELQAVLKDNGAEDLYNWFLYIAIKDFEMNVNYLRHLGAVLPTGKRSTEKLNEADVLAKTRSEKAKEPTKRSARIRARSKELASDNDECDSGKEKEAEKGEDDVVVSDDEFQWSSFSESSEEEVTEDKPVEDDDEEFIPRRSPVKRKRSSGSPSKRPGKRGRSEAATDEAKPKRTSSRRRTPSTKKKRKLGRKRATPDRWTVEEDSKLKQLVKEYGEDWKIVADSLNTTKDASSCAQHWRRVARPGIKKGPWTKAEEKKLVKLVDLYGLKQWSALSQNLPGRADTSCRSRYYAIIQGKVPRSFSRKKRLGARSRK